MEADDLYELHEAHERLLTPGLAAKVTNLLGKPIEEGFASLPVEWSERVGSVTRNALHFGMRVALSTLGPGGVQPSLGWHKAAVALSGATGGAFGLAGLVVELPVSTTIMCRSIADIARANGEALDTPEAQLACLEVFALGGASSQDDAVETGYFAVRAALARSVSEASKYVAAYGFADRAAPALVRLIAQVAARFQIQVTEKAAAQAVPLVGAASGALLNVVFIDHFQQMSRAHFTIRRLERRYGEQVVREALRAA